MKNETKKENQNFGTKKFPIRTLCKDRKFSRKNA